MKAAIVTKIEKAPEYGDFDEPIPQAGEVLVTVTATAFSPLTKARASGKHYSSSASLPFIPGVDGVGRLADGKRVFFMLPRHPYGSMAEVTCVKASQCIPLPEELDDVTAAAIGNPGMSSWAALNERARLVSGENVLINGATGSAGSMAVRIAKHLGAKRVIATGRDLDSLQLLRTRGADETICLTQPVEELKKALREQFDGQGIDIVLDYLWGQSAEQLIEAIAGSVAASRRVRYVEIGSASGTATISLPGAALRSCGLELMGSGLGSVPLDRLVAAVSELMRAAVPSHLGVATQTFPLADVEETWSKDTGKRRVIFLVGK